MRSLGSPPRSRRPSARCSPARPPSGWSTGSSAPGAISPPTGRQAAAEAIFGVALWRRRLRFHAGEAAPPLLLLASLLRDLAGRPDAERLCGLPAGALPPPVPSPADLATRYSMPDWLAETLVREVGAEAPLLADALSLPGPVFLRVNRARATRDGLAARLAAEGVATRPTRLAPDGLEVLSPRPNLLALPSFREGLLEVQDEGSQLARRGRGRAARRGGPRPLRRRRREDPPARRRGRSGRNGSTPATRTRPASSRLRARAGRAGAAVTVHGAEAPAGLLADRVLVDAPCSELGALRRGPDLRFRIEPASFAALPRAPARDPGAGRPARPPRRAPRLRHLHAAPRGGRGGGPGLRGGRAEFTRSDALPGLSDGEGFLRLWPHRHGTDGFFAAAWTRSR